jgi:predicted nucleic acid-binding protein
MTRAILADTGPLYAAVDPDDQYRELAQSQLQALADEGVSVVLAYPTLLEAYTLILYRLGYRSAFGWLEDVRAGTALVNPTPQDYRNATVLVSRFPGRSISLFDATMATLASRLGLPVWTYDHQFDAMKTAVWR